MLNCFVCAKEREDGFKLCPFCLVRYCGDCCRDTNLQQHKRLHSFIRRDMPLVAAEVTEGMCAQVAEEEAKSVCEESVEESRQEGADPLESEGADPLESGAANPLVVQHCVVCGQETNMQCKGCKAIHICSPACQQQVWPAHMEECAGKFVFVYAPDALRDTIFEMIGETREDEQEVLRQQKVAKDLLKRCHGCWENKGTMKCGVCLVVYYCSRACKDKNHLEHQQVCKKAEAHHDEQAKAKLRMIFNQVYAPNELEQSMDLKLKIVKNLQRHPKNAKVAKDLAKILGKELFSDPFKVPEKIAALKLEGKHEVAQKVEEHFAEIGKIMEKHQARAASK